MVLMPRSGTPREFAATPPPERYRALKPAGRGQARGVGGDRPDDLQRLLLRDGGTQARAGGHRGGETGRYRHGLGFLQIETIELLTLRPDDKTAQNRLSEIATSRPDQVRGAPLPRASRIASCPRRRSSCTAAPKLSRRGAGPFLKCAMKRAALGEPELQGDVHDASVRVAQITDGEIAAQLILDPLIGGALIVQAPPQRGGGHVQFGGERIEIRHFARQPLPQPAADRARSRCCRSCIWSRYSPGPCAETP